MIKADQHKQVEFIKDILRESGKRDKILAMFVNKWQKVSVRTFDRRLKEAEKQLQSEFKEIAKKTEDSIKVEVESRKLKIMTIAERMDILAKMANGELEREDVVFIDGQPKKMKVKPTFNDMRGAIAELNKMQGDYAPAKSEISITDKPKIIFPGDEPTDE